MNDRHLPAFATARTRVDLVLPAGARLGPFEVQRLIARGGSSFVYLATDHALAMPVAIQEYLPSRMVYRDAWLHLHPNEAWHEDVLSRGMRVFIDESRLLARCEHPALVRVNHLFEANGTAYRVMPFHPGQRLSEVRSALNAPPAEGPLRALLEPLLGALEAIHRLDQVHGGVVATNILLIDDDFPLLLSPGAAAAEIRSDLVNSLMATVESQPGALLPEPSPTGPALDLRGLAEVMRFCITGDGAPAARPREALASLIARQAGGPGWPVYSSEFIGTLDAATSSSPEDWPNSVAQFRLWLTHGTPAARASAPRHPPRVAHTVAPPPAPVRAPLEPVAPKHPDALDLSGLSAEPTGEPFFLPMETAPAAAPRVLALPGDAVFAAEAAPIRPARTRHLGRGLAAKLLFGGVLAGLAVGIIAWVSGAWNLMPAIPLVRDGGSPVARIDAPVPPALERVQTPAPVASPKASVAPSNSPATEASPPAAAPVAAPSAPLVDTTPAIDPERTVMAHPPGAGAVARASTPPPASPPARTRAAPTKTPRAPADPRSACAGRTEFALYRCMKQQCQTVKWSANPQCVRLRLNDRVE